MSASDEAHGLDEAGGPKADRDARLVPAAIAGWMAALAGSRMAQDSSRSSVPALALVGAVACVGCLSMLVWILASRPDRRRKGRAVFLQSTVVLAAVLAVLVSCEARAVLLVHDPLSPQAMPAAPGLQGLQRQPGQQSEPIEAILRVSSPPIASSRRGSECRYEADALALRSDGVARASAAHVWVWGSGAGCSAGRGERIRVRGSVSPPRYGQADGWLTVRKDSQVALIRPAGRSEAIVSSLWSAFFRQCRKLPAQARLLVPGMTIGVLGSQAVVSGQILSEETEQQQAKQLTEMFRTVGIVHLLAVSGGHFAIVGGAVRRRLGLLGAPAWLVGLALGGAYWALTAILFPADSVTRAVVMALLAALATGIGRPSQSLAALSLTVLILLIARPSLAQSLGFALSCAAVCGILLFASPLADLFGRWHVPRSIAVPLSATLCAQAFTLPLQMLMGPVPDWRSVPANLLTSPFVDAATILGLLSLATCRWLPPVGLALARAASVPTGIIVLLADWLVGLA